MESTSDHTEATRRTRYICTVGHGIRSEHLEMQTKIVQLDEGASVRICLEHGAPIAQTVERSRS